MPCDFVIVHMPIDPDVNIILGRPFLATTNALIDNKIGLLALNINDESIYFQGSNRLNQLDIIKSNLFCPDEVLTGDDFEPEEILEEITWKLVNVEPFSNLNWVPWDAPRSMPISYLEASESDDDDDDAPNKEK